MKKKVLIIDDDLNICKEIKYSLQSETTDVYYALSAQDGFEQFTKHQFCLIIMDIQLSETDGLLLLEKLRKMNPMPILVISSKSSNVSRIEALKAGAAGYMEKPYALEECLAHAQSLIQLYADINPISKRRYTLAFGMELVIDPELRQATLKGESLNLTPKEFDLLFCLAEHAGQVLSREQLYGYVWNQGVQYNVDELIKAHIKALRRKLTPAGKEYIKNVWGIGYRFSTDEEQP
ncbi:response regulator transcription factor [Enterocloster bolteae]|uniref:response regulator transcription factor n=1 Tax=Enterocloster bolteae TaxID=208479 RepID=UPI00210BCDE2|nr:response regulator transcription factor [Enterocloster bolteae]